MNITKNFTMAEAKCKCGCEAHLHYLNGIYRLSTILQIIRVHWGAPIIVNSWCRCPLHNVRVGGVPGSYHIKGIAADIRPSNGDINEFATMVRCMHYGALPGLIWHKMYGSFVHVDARYL